MAEQALSFDVDDLLASISFQATRVAGLINNYASGGQCPNPAHLQACISRMQEMNNVLMMFQANLQAPSMGGVAKMSAELTVEKHNAASE